MPEVEPVTTACLLRRSIFIVSASSVSLPGPASRTGRRTEHAAARVVGPSANPYLSVRARCRLFERNEFRAADDPAFAGHGDLVGRLAVVVAATPLARRISVAAA